jgi:hypothetical protein
MRFETALVGIYFAGLGGGLCAWGMLNLRKVRKAARARVVEAGAVPCICPARLPGCDCIIGGDRNPRGAGRAMVEPRWQVRS